MDVTKKLIKARAELVMQHPFFGSLALRLKMTEDSSKKTASCDGLELRYNKAYVDKLSLQKTQGLIAHEVMHAALLHHTRRNGRDKKRWNMACDYAINPILTDAGIELPEGTYNNPQYKNQSVDHIYSLLPVDPDNGNGSGSGGGGGGGRKQGDQNQDPNQNPNQDPGGDGGVDDSPNSTANNASQSQQQHEESEWKVAMSQAAHVAKQAGKLPADIERMLGELLEPQIPWRNILRRFMTERANDDFSWAKGNRRFLHQGLYLPSRYSEGSGAMVVAIDTSGSISQKELDEFGAEIQAIVSDVKPSELVVIYCDARIAHIDRFKPDDDIEFKIHGGGGTDFRPPFDWVAQHGIEPKAFVYFTDGYGPFPDYEASYPTLWCINNDHVYPPWGEHLTIAS